MRACPAQAEVWRFLPAPGETLPAFPSGGIAPQSDARVVAGARSVGRARLIPGNELSHFVYIQSAAH
ncbi:MAG TPA: hypothetical protein VG345_13440, partial [Bryobacteraceae bacterium]|nr:hypothetical protein [Bryobacteraceae bacterium]